MRLRPREWQCPTPECVFVVRCIGAQPAVPDLEWWEIEEYARIASAEDHHWWYLGMRAIAQDVLASLALPPTPLILDAGCGTGGNARFLRRYGTVVGIDLAAEALDLGGERLPGVLARASAGR